MRTSLSPLRALLVACATSAAAMVPTPGSAQNARPAVAPAAPSAWIGVSFDLTAVVDSRGTERSRLLVSDVHPSGPAWRAGIRPGDILVSVDGRTERDMVPALSGLAPGASLRVRLVRDGRPRDVVVQAAAPPAGTVMALAVTSAARADSLVDGMYRSIDSLRVSLSREGTPVRVTVVSGGGGGAPFPTPSPPMVRTGTTYGPDGTVRRAGEVRPPFSFFVFQGARHDSLTREMDRLNQEIRQANTLETRRRRELASSTEPSRRSDPTLQRLSQILVELDARGAELRGAMERAALEVAQQPEPESRGWVWHGRSSSEEDTRSLRPLAPYVLGQNRTAGAEVVDLKPELAAYFGVEGGVLVVDVPGGTPAAMAGVLPGDVVTAVAGRSVASVPELRAALVGAGGAGPLRVVRKGRVMLVRLGN